MADSPNPGTATPAEPSSPSPASPSPSPDSAEPVVYPAIGTVKVFENGQKPGQVMTRSGSEGGRDSRSGS